MELLVASNPSGRKRRQSAKQRAASLRNLKKARRARRGGKHRRRSNPVAAANPSRKRRRAASYSPRRVKRRRNPSLSLRRFSLRNVTSYVMPALVGGGGAVANDVLYNVALNALPQTLPMLEQFRSGQLRHVGKALSALLLSTVAGFVLPRRIADQMGTGALTVVGYNVVRDAVTRFATGLNLGMYLAPDAGGLGWAGAGWNPAYGGNWSGRQSGLNGGLGAYLRNGGGAGGGLTAGPQFKTTAPFTSRAAVYADELEA